MKKILLLNVISLLIIQIAFAGIFEDCSWADNSSYSMIEHWDEGDTTNLGNLDKPSGVAWTESVGDSQISIKRLCLDGVKTVISGSLDAHIANVATIEFEINVTTLASSDYNAIGFLGATTTTIMIRVSTDGSITYTDGIGTFGDTGIDVTLGQIHRFNITINDAAFTYVLDIDGTRRASDGAYFANEAIATWWIQSLGGGAFCIDNMYIINNSDGCPPVTPPPPPTPINLTITANNSINRSQILIFNATVNGTFYTTTNGMINTSITNVTIAPINITIDSQEYHSFTFIEYNGTLEVEVNLTKKFNIINLEFTGVVNFSENNYSRNLTQVINLTCSDEGNTSLFTFINETLESQEVLTCNNESQLITQYYQHPKEGGYNLSYSINTTTDHPFNNQETRSSRFRQDSFNPGINLHFNISQGFSFPSVTINLTCNDTISPILNYTSIFNGINIFTGINKSNTSIINNTIAIDGVNTALGICRDFFGDTNLTLNITAYSKTLQLIDEKTGSLFDCTNITSCKIFADDNSTFYDLKGNATSEINYTGTNIFNLRAELGYLNNVIITRWIDIRLINTSNIRICANKEGVTHFEQLIIAGTERPTILTNIFANCIVAADNTRFAYQDSLVLKAFTIHGLYFLYTFSTTGGQILLSSIDGSIAAFINLDTLDFKLSSFNLDIIRDALSFRKTGDTEVTLYYQNLEENNENIRLQIERMDTSVSVLDTTTFTNPNQFTLIFDWSTLSNITNNTLFKTTLTRTTDTGEILSFKKYFNTAGSTGVMNSAVSFTIALLLMIFGLSITTARITFSWFGIIITIASIAILSFAISTWYITMLLGLNTVILVYIVVTLISLNYPTIT